MVVSSSCRGRSAGGVEPVPAESPHAVWTRVDHGKRSPLDLQEGMSYREFCLSATKQNPSRVVRKRRTIRAANSGDNFRRDIPRPLTGGLAFLGPGQAYVRRMLSCPVRCG